MGAALVKKRTISNTCFLRRFPALLRAFVSALFALSSSALVSQAQWIAVGPAGGDARSFASVPGHSNHLYMGTTNSWLYESTDGGSTWHRLSKLAASDDLIVDHILVGATDPATIYVAAWTVDHPDGGLWISRDGGKTWAASAGLRGQSIRAFVRAPSNSRIFFAGTLAGVFRSTDSCATWELISPKGSSEIHEVESLAIDPRDTDTVYAGTWHLPWKTTDGGKTWNNIRQGLIDDSDVFSIIIDPVVPSTAFLSACSGIYKTEDAAELFHKIQGIPSSARRTRVLMQDPINRDVVYAGTTEGLYKTLDGGKTFQRMTGPDVIVNDVFVNPEDTQHVLLATDRGGVLLSRDGGRSFIAANNGFSGRKVEALLIDPANPERLLAGVANDKTYGGVFVSSDGGTNWEHIAEGLNGSDVFALAKSPDGTLLAGTNQGLFLLDSKAAGKFKPGWVPRNTVQNDLVKKSIVIRKGKKVTVETRIKQKPHELRGRVFALDLSGNAWLASTSEGLLTSRDRGTTWQGGPVLGSREFVTVAVHGSTMVAAWREGAVVSTDGGQTWISTDLPRAVTRIDRAAFSADGAIWLGGREGVNVSRDQGKSWLWMERLPFRDVNDLYYDASQNKVLVTSRMSDFVYAIDPVALTWKWTRAGWKIYLIRGAAGHLLAASLYDGVLVEPRVGAATAGGR